jgi:hypothetical protein
MADAPVVLFDKTQNGWRKPREEGVPYSRYRQRVRQDGFEDAVREQIKDLARNKRKFEDLVNNSEKILFKTKSMFPFTWFPDEMIIDPIKINVISKEFFSAERIHCIYIKNILDVFLDVGPFSSTLRIVDQSFTENTVVVAALKKQDAYKARKIIQGLIVAHQQEIDVTGIDDEDLTEKLERLGNAGP